MHVEATSYTIYPTGWDELADVVLGPSWTLLVEMRSPGRWTVTDGVRVYDREGNRETEPQPSSRSDEFTDTYRMSLDTAINVALALVDHRRNNGRTYREALAEWKSQN